MTRDADARRLLQGHHMTIRQAALQRRQVPMTICPRSEPACSRRDDRRHPSATSRNHASSTEVVERCRRSREQRRSRQTTRVTRQRRRSHQARNGLVLKGKHAMVTNSLTTCPRPGGRTHTAERLQPADTAPVARRPSVGGAPFGRCLCGMAPVGDKVIRRTYPTMTMALLAALALSSLASASMTGPLGVNPRARSFYSYLRQVHPHRYSSSEPGDVDANLPEERWFPDQQVDHFNGENTQTFAQRYFVNDTFWDRQKGPVFLYIGGEGALSPRDAYAGHHMELAEKFHALVIAIEHRFYGKTFPSSDLSTKNLRHLSSAQALADIATFIAHARAKFGFGNAPLISFGGSYSGALSAWFRIKYPHLVFAAVASSAPVHALTDFYQYNDVVGRSLAAAVVGGSEHCKERVKSGFVHLDDMLDKGLYEEASAAFRSCSPVTTSDDAVQLVSDLAGIFEGTVQYNNQMSLNVERICSIMTDPETSPFEALQKLNDHVLDSTETECADYSAESMIHQLANATIIDDGPVGMRQWLYQTCTQFGYYQTCEGRNCIFSKRMTLRSNTDLCSALFGVDLDNLDARIDFSNDDYGADRPAGSRILFVNGVIDPWHALSVLKDATSGVDESAFVMRSTSHCQNMHGSNPDDSEELRQGRMFIERKVASWLYDAQRPLVSSS